MILPGRTTSGQPGPLAARSSQTTITAACRLNRPDPSFWRAASPRSPRTYRQGHSEVSLPALVLTVLLTLLCAMVFPAQAARPWIIETPQDVQFNVRRCQPLSVDDLKRQMGAAWDASRMAADADAAEDLESALENNDDEEEEEEDEDVDDSLKGYQGDDPGAGYMEERLDVVTEDQMVLGGGREEVEVEEKFREEFMASDDGLEVVEEEEEDIVETIDDRFKHPYLEDIHTQEDLIAGSRTESVRPRGRHYKRRRRRSSRYTGTQGGGGSSARSSQTRERGSRGRTRKDREKINTDLTMRLFRQGKNKKMRKQLKRKFRQNAKFLKRKDPPWQCKMKRKSLFMKHGIFPRVITGGECVARKCFYRLFNCEPSYYAITLLQRDPDYCNPVPTVGNSTVYEERWNLVKYQVVVGCNCASVSSSGKRRRRP